MAAHHVVELVVSGVVCAGKLVLSELGQVLAEALVELVKAPFRRKKGPPKPSGLERKAEERRAKFWAEVLTKARTNASDRPDLDPHLMKLPRIPTPPRADRAPYLADRGDGASRPPHRSTDG